MSRRSSFLPRSACHGCGVVMDLASLPLNRERRYVDLCPWCVVDMADSIPPLPCGCGCNSTVALFCSASCTEHRQRFLTVACFNRHMASHHPGE